MFLANLFARSQPYSTRQLAERALVGFIRKRDTFLSSYNERYIQDFNDCVGKEDFGGALNVWNKCVQHHWCNNSLYLATITEAPSDIPFT